MNRRILTLVLWSAGALAADDVTTPDLIEMAHRGGGSLRDALIQTMGADDLNKGTAVFGKGEEFVWAVQSVSPPTLSVDGEAGPPMQQVAGTNLWYAMGKLAAGTSHEFQYTIDGKSFGGSQNVPAYGPESYLKPGVPTGTLSEKLVHTSKIYDGLRSDYWIYVPAQYDPRKPAALMVWQDGHQYNKREEGSIRILDAVDNLTHEGKIPVMIQVFISPGDITQAPASETYKEVTAELERRRLRFARFRNANANRPQASLSSRLNNVMRSIEYDTVSDRYARFLRDELLPEVEAKYNIRKDAYSRAIGGLSSGGICAFNTAWQMPGQFSRVLSWIGSFVSLQSEPDFGGQAFPAKVQLEEKRNIRVWLQDGAEDNLGWPEQNIQLANSLKRAGYDFHFSYGVGTHSSAQGSAEFPASFAWLWRDYDPGKTEQEYEQEEAEREKPPFRVSISNRDHGATK